MSVIISLTTIPGRVHILPDFLRSLQRQRVQPDRIELNLPIEFKMRKFEAAERKQIPSDFNVFDCEDVGPATKILPTLKRYEGTDQRIVYCDDDRVYGDTWLERLTSLSDQHPDTAIADECGAVDTVEYRVSGAKKDVKYRLKRVASFGLYTPFVPNRLGDNLIVEGYGGVLVKPDFFHPHVIDVPKQAWPVDDVWLSANLEANGTPIKWTQRTQRQRSSSLRIDGQNISRDAHALATSSFEGMHRNELDWTAVEHCREVFGIWQTKPRAKAAMGAEPRPSFGQ